MSASRLPIVRMSPVLRARGDDAAVLVSRSADLEMSQVWSEGSDCGVGLHNHVTRRFD